MLNRRIALALCLPATCATGLLAGCGSSDQQQAAKTTETRSASGSIASRDVSASICNEGLEPFRVTLTSAKPGTRMLTNRNCASTIPYDAGGIRQALRPCSINASFSLPRKGASALPVRVFFVNDATSRGFALGTCNGESRNEPSGFWSTAAKDPPVCVVIANGYYIEVDQQANTPRGEVPLTAVVGAGKPRGCKPLSSSEVGDRKPTVIG